MAREAHPPEDALTRRGFLGLASVAAAGLWLPRARAGPPEPARRGVPADAQHALSLRLPERTRNGAKVPIVVEAWHPMTRAHSVTSLEVVNDSDPVPCKGIFHFTPASGAAYVAFQARMHGGDSEVKVTAKCSRNGRWTASRRIRIPEDAGGCGGTAPAPGLGEGGDAPPPELRIVELVQRGGIRRGEVIHPQLKIRHPNRTGLAEQDGSFVEASEPLHLRDMEVWFAGERVSRFELTPALADDPFITFALLASREGSLEVHLVNNRGQRFEAAHEIRFS